MKRSIGNRAFILGLLLVCPRIGMSFEGVKLVCDDPVYNFGQINQSAVVTNVFNIRNEGDLSVVLKAVRTSCSCTKGQIDKWIIGPGETTRLTAVFTAARRKGPQKKSLKLISSESDVPVLTLYLEGFVEPAAESH